MKGSPSSVRLAQGVLALLGVSLLAPGAAQAQTTYKFQPIIKAGDETSDPAILVDTYLGVSALNDNGQMVVDIHPPGNQAVVQFTDGKFTPILVGGTDGPEGEWPQGVGTSEPISMNQRGDFVIAADQRRGLAGTFLWDYAAQKFTAVALKGMPAANNLTFEDAGGWAPVINNSGEIALVAKVKNAAGHIVDSLFFRDRDGKLLPIALPGQELPGGGKVDRAWLPSLNDAGLVAFPARQADKFGFSAYLWAQGTITPLLAVDADAPGGGKFANVRGIWLNNKNHNVLLLAAVATGNTQSEGLYLLAGGQLTPVAVPGQEMPGGGKLNNIQSAPAETWPTGVSFANDAGQHAFLARLEDNSTAAYLMDADGKLSLILKSGTTTDLGTITRLGRGTTANGNFSNGIGLNSKGQVALSVDIAGGRTTLVLLTPTAQ
jgi:hypothetical protein